MKKAILFVALSLLGTGVSMAAPAPAAAPAPVKYVQTNSPQTIQQAMDNAYKLGEVMGPEFGKHPTWMNNDQTNGVNSLNSFWSNTIHNIDNNMHKNGYKYGMSSLGQENLRSALTQAFNDGMNAAVKHSVTPFVS